ncbi:MAG: hypothetical protein U0263_02950 [Polyangiaceae bacterium]
MPAPSDLRPRLRQRLALTLLLCSFLSSVASCSSLFGLDDYTDSAGELCDLLEKCYDFQSCATHVEPKLDAASSSVRSEWLSAVSSKACLTSCSKSRKCLNIAPVCKPVPSPCTRKEECCDFLSGSATCKDSKCCKPDGLPDADGTLCCSGVEKFRNGSCGGQACRTSGNPCNDNLDCCSGNCAGNLCSEEICLDLGVPCSPGDTCCAGAECIGGVCGFPAECRPLHKPCRVGATAGQEGACCENLDCTSSPVALGTDDDGVCQDPGNLCLVEGTPCTPADKCCESLACDNITGVCRPPCIAVDQLCGNSGDCCSGVCGATGACECSELYCTTQADCCGGICIGGLCTGTCAPTACHDVCVPGSPLDGSGASSCGTAAQQACVQQVCKADEFCCCNAWDLSCATAAVALCGKAICSL